MLQRKKCIFVCFRRWFISVRSALAVQHSQEMNGTEPFEFCLDFSLRIFFSLHNFRWVLKKAQESQLQLLSQLFQDIATNCPRLYRKNHIYSLIHSHYGAISHEKECTFAAIEKQFIAFSCNIYTAPILSVLLFFFGGCAWKKWMNENFGWKICEFYWMGKNLFPPTPTQEYGFSILMLCYFLSPSNSWCSRCRFNSMEKNIENFSTNTVSFFCVCSPRQSNFSSSEKRFFSRAATENEHLTNCHRIQ